MQGSQTCSCQDPHNIRPQTYNLRGFCLKENTQSIFLIFTFDHDKVLYSINDQTRITINYNQSKLLLGTSYNPHKDPSLTTTGLVDSSSLYGLKIILLIWNCFRCFLQEQLLFLLSIFEQIHTVNKWLYLGYFIFMSS